ncbi:MAG: hypothetical protein KR126chlam4_01209 [Candidatus Anoxychlamydiales bacterium]|uniref:Uncharacterized protein n=1 Tax=marine sediment metagenome TaxID=412755 RepID=A0A0F9C5L9_9ZZZZ|nr:hypothetical protein [Candidatus Anoxychlamydiales bacterium]HEU64687.1 hypothetical protein [Chlamydiota bacterium]
MKSFIQNLGIPPNDRWGTSKNWPNTQTAITSTSAIFNLACATIDSPMDETLGLNAPIRAFSIIHALYHQRYFKAALDIPAFVVLMFPNGRLISVIIDVASEILNFNQKISVSESSFPKVSRLDPKILANALRILSITEDKKDELDFINSQHLKITKALEEKKSKLSDILAKQVQLLIDDANVAKNTLLYRLS